MIFAPIVLFTYNRLCHTQQVVEALQNNQYASQSDLIIYSDGYDDDQGKCEIDKVRFFLNSIVGFRSIQIIERNKNWGLANNVIDGVTSIVNQYGKVIVLEDDLVVSPYFLKYMNEALNFYENDEQVICIHGYVYPVKKQLPETFFIKGADCWGWATWKRGWDLFCSDGKALLNEIDKRNLKKEFDFDNSYPYYKMLKQQVDGNNNSWAIRWYASAFLNNKLTLYPGRSLVKQIGMDGSGTHCGENTVFNVQLVEVPINVQKIQMEETLIARKIFTNYFRYTMKIEKLRSLVKKILK